MAELLCPNCGTSYDTAGFEPGERFRCRGDGCNEKLTVPETAGGDETPTPAPAAPAGKRRKKSGVVKVAAPAAASPVDDAEDVLEPRAKASRRRGGTGRRSRGGGGGRRAEPEPTGPVDRHGRPLPQASSPAPLYVAIGGVVLIVLIVVFAMMGSTTGGPPKDKPKKGKKRGWQKSSEVRRKSAERCMDTVGRNQVIQCQVEACPIVSQGRGEVRLRRLRSRPCPCSKRWRPRRI